MARFETFGDLTTAVANAVGANSVADLGAARQAHVELVINNAVRHVHERMRFKHLEKRAYFTTFVAETATSGAAINNGSPTLTLPAGVAKAVHVGGDVVLNSVNTPYPVHARAVNDLTLGQNYTGVTLANAAYTVIQGHLTMPEDFDTLVAAMNTTDDDPIEYIERTLLYKKVVNPFERDWSEPRFCCLDGRIEASAGGLESGFDHRPWRLLLYPAPDAVIDIIVDYVRMVNEMTAITDEPDLPPQHRQLIYELAVAALKDPEGVVGMSLVKSSMESLERKPPASPRVRKLGSAWRGGRGFPEEKITV